MDNARTTEPLDASRREFLRGSGAALVVPFTLGVTARPALAAATTGATTGEASVGAYIRIAADNTVTVVLGSSEMGQGILTGLSQLVGSRHRLPLSGENIFLLRFESGSVAIDRGRQGVGEGQFVVHRGKVYRTVGRL